MARRPRLFAPGVLYHVIVRGNQRQKTFTSDSDYQAYLERLAKYRRQFGYTIYAYCLMSNHVHLLVQSSATPLAKFMQGLQQSFTQYFNRRHKKSGHLFEGRYKAIVCQEDPYLLELIRYIHLNPVRAGIVNAAEKYEYSGHHAYVRSKATEIIEPARVLRMLGGSRGYQKFVQEGLKDGHKEEYYAVEDQRFLGDEEFTESLRSEEDDERPKPRRKADIDATARKLSKFLKVEIFRLKGTDRGWEVSKARTQIAYILVRRVGYRLSDVAEYFARDIATVGTLLARLNAKAGTEPNEQIAIDRLIKIVNP
jgi:REP-associated tyrosine transposase